MNFYKRFMGDYARGTAHLSLAEHGAYSLLLDYYYATEKGLPDDRVALYRICRAFTPEEQQAVASVTAQGAATITAPSISIGASGQSLLSFVTSLFQALFNGHTHLSNGAGQQTNVPTQQMTAAHMTSTVKGG